MTPAIPYLIAFIAISCYASLTVLSKKVMPDIPSFSFIAITMFILAGLATAAALMYEHKDFSPTTLSLKSWGWIIGFSLINFAGFGLYLYAIKFMPIAHYQTIGLALPLVGGLLAFVLLEEVLTLRFFAGFLIAAFGIFIAVKK